MVVRTGPLGSTGSLTSVPGVLDSSPTLGGNFSPGFSTVNIFA